MKKYFELLMLATAMILVACQSKDSPAVGPEEEEVQEMTPPVALMSISQDNFNKQFVGRSWMLDKMYAVTDNAAQREDIMTKLIGQSGLLISVLDRQQAREIYLPDSAPPVESSFMRHDTPFRFDSKTCKLYFDDADFTLQKEYWLAAINELELVLVGTMPNKQQFPSADYCFFMFKRNEKFVE